MSARLWIALLTLLLGCSEVTWQPPPAPHIPIPPAFGETSSELEGFEDDEPASPTAPTDATLAQLRKDARAVEPLVESAWVKELTRAVTTLPAIAPTAMFHDEAKTRYLTAAEHAAAVGTKRSSLVRQPVDTKLFYMTKYGSPLAYARALDLVARAGMAHPRGKSVVDFGYGTIGHLRLLASLGARTQGVDVDPFLRAIYHGAGGKHGAGSVALHDGRFPAEAAIAKAIGTGHALFISKNVLKNGYIHPAKKVPKKQIIDLGVSDDSFVASLAELLAPGGYAIIYNISPAPNGPGKKYRTWADGRCPFPKAMWKKHGFEVLAYDVDDSVAARTQGVALGWASMDELSKNLFAMYTIARKK